MNTLGIWLRGPAVESVGWALFHFVWQGAAAAVFLVFALELLKGRSAQARYVLSCTVLAMMAVCPVATWIWLVKDAHPAVQRNQLSAAAVPTPTAIVDGATPIEGVASTAAQGGNDLIPTVASQPPVTKSRGSRWAHWSGVIEPILPWCVCGWSMGVVAFSMRLLFGFLRVNELRRHDAWPASARWQEVLRRLTKRLAMTRVVTLVESARVSVPTVVGWVRPLILLPASAVTCLSPDQLESLLAHELAHIRRHDYFVNIVQVVIETLLFYHPAVWWVSRQIRREREACCDDVAIVAGVDRMGYVRALLAMEELRSSLPSLALSASDGSLRARIARLVLPPPKNGPGWPLAGAIGLGSIAVLLVGLYVSASDQPPAASSVDQVALQSAPKDPNAEEKAIAPKDPNAAKPVDDPNATIQISGRIIDDETGKPIEQFVVQGGKVDVQDAKKINWGQFESRMANPQGTFQVSSLPWRSGWRARIIAKGYLPQIVLEDAKDPAPRDFYNVTVRMKRGKEVRGRVVDHNGKPVARASVFHVDQRVLTITGGKAVIYHGPMDSEDEAVTKAITDADGRFSLTGAAEGSVVAVSAPTVDAWAEPLKVVEKEITIRLPQPGRLVIRYDIDGADDEVSVMLNLKAQKNEGWYGVFNDRRPKVPNRGELVLENMTPGTYDITRQTRPLRVGEHGTTSLRDWREIVVESGKTAEVDFVRKGAFPVSGQVVGLDPDKHEGAFIFVRSPDVTSNRQGDENWLKPLYDAVTCGPDGNFKTEGLLPGKYKLQVDVFLPLTEFERSSTGVVSPALIGEAEVEVPKDRAPDKVRIEVKPRKDVVVLKKSDEKAGLRVSGRVIDSKTKEPVAKFRLIVGSPYDDQHTTWQPHLVTAQRDGALRWETQRPWGRTRLRIEAEGYRPAVSRILTPEGDVKLDFELVPDPGISGVVKGSDGKPAAGAQVALATQTLEVSVENGGLKYHGHAERLGGKIITADDDGRVRLPPEVDPAWVVAAHPEGGYAQAELGSFAESPVLNLESWGSLNGTMRIGDAPQAGVSLAAQAGRQPKSELPVIQHRGTAVTDAKGQFVIDKLPAGSTYLQRIIKTDNAEMSIPGLAMPVNIESGKMLRVSAGTPGLNVQGRLVLPAGQDLPKGFDWSLVELRIFPRAPHIGIPGDDAIWKVYGEFMNSDEGRRYKRDKVPVQKDGSFRIEDLPPGDYQLQVTVQGDDKTASSVHVQKGLSVPAALPEPEDLPVDIGAIPATVIAKK